MTVSGFTIARTSDHRVSPGCVAQYGQRWLQIERDQTVRIARGATVLVREHRDGSLSVWHQRSKLRRHELEERPWKPVTLPKPRIVRRQPAADHPWRQWAVEGPV